ncbi:acyltransferase family protein [Chloroflexi bacterium TSY]|nr:acyltransferase family protein [Chloroflexi bacterium TSY]
MRYDFIDNARAFGIILVVLGHTAGLIEPLGNFIYSFHMPLFFCISGFLFSNKRLQRSFYQYSTNLARSLLVPYTLFFVVAYVYWLLTRSLGSNAEIYADMTWFQPVKGLLFGNEADLFVNPVLWFFPCLFVTSLSFFVLRQRVSKITSLILLGIFGGAVAYWANQPTYRLPWNLELSLVAGALFMHLETSRDLMLVASRISNENNLLFCLSGTSCVLWFSLLLKPSSIMSWLSQNTIVIFPTHTIVFRIFTGIGVTALNLPFDFKESFLFALIYTVGALFVSYPTAYIMKNYFPFMVGGRS